MSKLTPKFIKVNASGQALLLAGVFAGIFLTLTLPSDWKAVSSYITGVFVGAFFRGTFP